uniref:Sodium transporter HKT1 n=1 Tax=Sesuvium portulacastrum TaxID=221166 RepID=A0A221LB19_SESPO|nr:sodium transporter HKT1 [Sesuvium portulacastrum]
MLRVGSLHNKFQHLYSCLSVGAFYFLRFLYWVCSTTYDFVIYNVNQFWIEVFYFIFVSCLGFVILRSFKPRTYPNKPRNLDFFFTSVSATTVSSMSTVEMEVFSDAQLHILTILMFIGGEVFTSMIGLHFKASKIGNTPLHARSRVNSVASLPCPVEGTFDELELGISTTTTTTNLEKTKSEMDFLLKSKSIRVLGFVVLAYLIVVHFIGIIMVLAYLNIETSAKKVLDSKGLKSFTFSIFTIVSTFASCGFIPTNENMIVFRRNSGLLLMLIPQVLLGNTLFPSFLRLSIWVLGKFTKKDESSYIRENTNELRYHHLLPSKHSRYLVVTVLGFILVQFILFCSMNWNLEGLVGLNEYQKLVGALFQCVNSRHTGESIVDLSTVASAVLVIFVVMMYLPPYTSILPTKDGEEEYPIVFKAQRKKGKVILDNVVFSQLSYLVIFIMIICITERHKMKEDPLNFNVLNIMVEVISAYGNVGFSTGYSCSRQLKPDANCVDKWYGFAGKWSDEGKIVLIIVMFLGRLKKFNMKGGKAWKLL